MAEPNMIPSVRSVPVESMMASPLSRPSYSLPKRSNHLNAVKPLMVVIQALGDLRASVAAQLEGIDPVAVAEVLLLVPEDGLVARPAVHEEERVFALSACCHVQARAVDRIEVDLLEVQPIAVKRFTLRPPVVKDAPQRRYVHRCQYDCCPGFRTTGAAVFFLGHPVLPQLTSTDGSGSNGLRLSASEKRYG